MIKFFRKIRQKLIDGGKLNRYLIYAIGEIILVVLGILIALQINNWNEEKKKVNYIESLLTTVESNLISDIQGVNSILNTIFQKDSLTFLVLADSLSHSDYRDDPQLSLLIYSSVAPLYLSEGIKTLLDKEEELPIKYKHFLSVAKAIEKRMISFDYDYNQLKDNTRQNTDFLAEHIPAYIRRDSATTAAKIDFYLNSEIYKTKVSRNWSLRTRLFIHVSHIRFLLTKMLIEVKSFKEKMSTSEIRELLNSLNFLQIHEVNCKDNVSGNKRSIGKPFLLLNSTENPIKLSITYLDGFNQPSSLEIEPLEIRYIPSMYRGIDGDHTQLVIQKSANESGCMKKFVSRKNGYLIIE